MADATITLQGVILKDNWPGTPTRPTRPFEDMTAASVGHNVVAPQFPLGTKWEVYCTGRTSDLGVKFNVGFATFIYLRAADDFNTTTTGAATTLCVPDNTMAAADPAGKLYTVTNDTADTTHETHGIAAVELSAITNDYYGWFWCGGVAPLQYVPGFTVTSVLQTDDSLDAGDMLGTIGITGTNNLGKIGLTQLATSSILSQCGIALYADGA